MHLYELSTHNSAYVKKRNPRGFRFFVFYGIILCAFMDGIRFNLIILPIREVADRVFIGKIRIE